MQLAEHRHRPEQRHTHDTDLWRCRREELRLLQKRVRHMFQDAERMYHHVQEQWNRRSSAPTAQAIHDE